MHTLPTSTEPITTKSRSEMIEITNLVQRQVQINRVTEGMVIVYVPHTTAGVTINENADPDVKHDLLRKLDALIPKQEPYYRHGEGNSDSHLKTSMLGNSVTVLIERGKLILGTWQGVQFCEFDGPRTRSVLIKIVSFDRPQSD